MKTKYILICITFVMSMASCNETSWLEEKPKDFYAPENSYITNAQFQQASNYLYNNLRSMYFQTTASDYRIALQLGSDLYYWGWDNGTGFANYSAYIIPTLDVVEAFWKDNYKAIVNANEIFYRLDQPNEVNDENKKVFRGEALFFRAMAYRFLAHVYGGVPLQLEHRTTPLTNFVRSSRKEVYEQCREDLKEAISLLPDIETVKDGKLSKQAAQHLLSEIYISLEQYDEAIEAASAVIDYSGMALMTTRFGVRKNEPGDVYWDLFRNGNINRSEGNTESIFVLQYEYNSSGSNYEDYKCANYLPQYRSAQVEAASGGGLVAAFSPSITAEKGGRGQANCAMSSFLEEDLWLSDFDNDIRNSPYNIVRDQMIDNSKAKGYGQYMIKDGWLRADDRMLRFFPFMMKVTGNFPEESYAKNSDGSYKLSDFGEHELIHSGGSARGTFRDEYCFRLAETYFLRAEAYLNKGDKNKAAADINKIRNRANATPVDAADVDIDYILDERARELTTEEFRNVTLFRLGKFVERSQKYNPFGYQTGDWQNLWPIPYSEIERNVEGNLEQNPGYY
ncbi:MAG: RagB/SusD family nutrient uptake outer membrane protein [Tannerella sp.]|jgi:tetratricopeptide (TPR) repeat protein|nr:RagB/SusD family nutrient uptake outer membrane protein [Tannerella sp.]